GRNTRPGDRGRPRNRPGCSPRGLQSCVDARVGGRDCHLSSAARNRGDQYLGRDRRWRGKSPCRSSVCGPMDESRSRSIRHPAALRLRSRRHLALARVMTPEFPPPDSRLVDKVAIIKLEPNKEVRRGNGSHGVAPSHDACPDVELESADVEISRLAKLAPLEYERQRKEAAERLDIRASILDRLVAAERSKSSIDGKQGRALSLPEPKPWPRAVNGADLVNELSASIRRHVVMHDHAADTAALWAVHTYLVSCFGTSP